MRAFKCPVRVTDRFYKGAPRHPQNLNFILIPKLKTHVFISIDLVSIRSFWYIDLKETLAHIHTRAKAHAHTHAYIHNTYIHTIRTNTTHTCTYTNKHTHTYAHPHTHTHVRAYNLERWLFMLLKTSNNLANFPICIRSLDSCLTPSVQEKK